MTLSAIKTSSVMLMSSAVILWSACGGSQEPQTDTAEQPAETPAAQEQPEAASMGQPQSGAPSGAPAAKKQPMPAGPATGKGDKPAGNQLASGGSGAGAPAERMITVAAGTEIKGELETPLSSKTNKAGDPFRLIVSEPIVMESMQVIPKGTVINGTVVSVTPAERGSKKASMDLKFNSMTMISGLILPIDAGMALEGEEEAADASVEGESKKGRNAAIVAGGAAAGALAGKLLGKGKTETVVGAVGGAAAGTAVALALKGGEVELQEGSALKLKLNNTLSVPVKVSSGSNVAGQ